MRDFQFDYRTDIYSASELEKICRSSAGSVLQSYSRLRELIKGRNVLVVGAAAEYFPSEINDNDITIIACDGVTTLFRKKGISPHIIVTDLDGNIDDLMSFIGRSYFVLHGHGDNIEMIKRYGRKIISSGMAIGTVQVNENDIVFNFHGFTDGDRAVAMAAYFDAGKILLYGFDFDKIGEYSYTPEENRNIKLKKLQWAKNLISDIAENSGIKLEYLY